MMERSAGILVYRISKEGDLEVLLGKCGGPKWERRFVGSWNIPKGHVEKDENDLDTALREFNEETSLGLEKPVRRNDITDLGTAKTSTGKEVRIFALEKNYNPNGARVSITSNSVKTEWPKGSGKIIEVPEMSEAMYFKAETAKRVIFPYQRVFLERLVKEFNKNKGSLS